jgi:DNA-binding response OmpR family regulator
MRATVLVVEDEPKLRDLVRTFLERDGLTVLTASTGADALTLATKTAPDLVVLDLGLPDVPGESVAAELRTRSDVLIIMLTAKAEESDRIRGLELGADDYVTKPFSPRELVLRVNALLRRGHGEPRVDEPISFGDGQLVIDDPQHQIRKNGELVALSPTEWALLRTLANVPGRVYSRSELANAARGYDWDGYERVIDSHIKNLRRKLHDDDVSARMVETVVGHGYRLCLRRDQVDVH